MKKYVLVGTGWRGTMAYLEPMVKEYGDCAELLAVCDPNESRATYVTEYIGKKGLPVYTDFDQMLAEQKPDVVIVTTRDYAHERYIIKALEFSARYCCFVIKEPTPFGNGHITIAFPTKK